MLKILKTILQQWINDIDSGNSNISEEESKELLELVSKINSKELSKIEAANYVGVSRATFDNYINNGWIPKGKKRQGFKELSWSKHDLNKFIEAGLPKR